MITREQAEHMAAQLVGAPPSNHDKGWALEEFDVGWLILKHASGNLRCVASHVVERASERVMRFPSYMPPNRIWRNTTRL